MTSTERHDPHPDLSSPTSDRGSRGDEVPRLERGGRQHDTTLHLKRDELRPEVRTYVDNLKAQILLEYRRLGIREAKGLDRLVALKRVKVEDVRKLKDLLEKFAKTSKSGELPIDVQELKRRGEQLLVEAAEEAEKIPDPDEKFKTTCAIIPSLYKNGLHYESLLNSARAYAYAAIGKGKAEPYFRMLAEIGRCDEALSVVRSRCSDLYLWRRIGSYIANRQITDGEDPSAALTLATETPDASSLVTSSDDVMWLSAVVRALARAGRIQEAIQFSRRLRDNAARAYLLADIGSSAVKHGNDGLTLFVEARNLLAGYEINVKRHVLPHIARELIKSGHDSVAEDIVMQLAEAPEAQDKVRGAIARAYAQIRKFDHAERWLNQMEHGSNDTEFDAEILVSEFARAGEFERAERTLERVRSSGLRRLALRWLAEVYWNKGMDPVSALSRYESEVQREEHEEERASAWRDYGVLLETCGRDGSVAFEEARSLAKDKLDNDPESALSTFNQLAEAEASVGFDPGESLAGAEKAARWITGHVQSVSQPGVEITLAKAISGAALIDFAVGKKEE